MRSRPYYHALVARSGQYSCHVYHRAIQCCGVFMHILAWALECSETAVLCNILLTVDTVPTPARRGY